MTTGISKDIHADINIGVHTDTHTHRGKWQKKKKMKRHVQYNAGQTGFTHRVLNK